MKSKSTKLPINQIVCGDCREIIKDWPDGCIDLILTDPPYGIDYDKVQGTRPKEKKRKVMADDEKTMTLSFLFRRPESKIIFGAHNFWQQIPTRGRWLCWDKRNKQSDNVLGGAFELAWLNREHGYFKIYRVLHGGWMNNDQYYGERKRWHPTQKPINLMRLILEDFSKPNDIIFDPFCGSGTTCIAAALIGRRYIGIDIDEGYCKISRERIQRITKRMLI